MEVSHDDPQLKQLRRMQRLYFVYKGCLEVAFNCEICLVSSAHPAFPSLRYEGDAKIAVERSRPFAAAKI